MTTPTAEARGLLRSTRLVTLSLPEGSVRAQCYGLVTKLTHVARYSAPRIGLGLPYSRNGRTDGCGRLMFFYDGSTVRALLGCVSWINLDNHTTGAFSLDGGVKPTPKEGGFYAAFYKIPNRQFQTNCMLTEYCILGLNIPGLYLNLLFCMSR